MDPLTRWPALDVPGRQQRLEHTLHISAGPASAALRDGATATARAAAGLWQRDPSVWSADVATQKKIANRLGWLSSPALMADSLGRVTQFADKVRHDGTTDVVLLGMGGSSLAPEVMRSVTGVAAGYPRFHMLDSTDPAAVRAVSPSPASTLYILASKSGSTIEPNSLAAHYRSGLEAAGISAWASHFVAITDPGTELAARADRDRFRDTFLNPPDIGGRYSALSYFGVIPAALMGQNISAMVGWGLAMLAAAQSSTVGTNPAVALGSLMGACARSGRDKLTLLLPSRLQAFGLWVEQLVAESTGKHGVGIVPIAGETPAAAPAYGADRLFVSVKIGDADGTDGSARPEFEAAGHPIATISWPETDALGAEFMRWEVATAITGALLDINPFDEPNVQQAKDATLVLLAAYQKEGRLPAQVPGRTRPDGITLTCSEAARARLGDRGPGGFLTLVGKGDYVATLAFLGPDPALAAVLHEARMAVRDRLGVATMFGYGPRYLHSTGQLHKGGADNGVFILITADPAADLPIPGEPFSFGTLELAQGRGDFASLESAKRRAVHIHLPRPDAGLLRAVLNDLIHGDGASPR